MAESAPKLEGTVSMKTPNKEIPKAEPSEIKAFTQEEEDMFEGMKAGGISKAESGPGGQIEKEARMPEPAEGKPEAPREIDPQTAARLTKIQKADNRLKAAIYGETANMDGEAREYIGPSEERVGEIIAAYEEAAELLNEVLAQENPDRKDLGNLEGMLFKATRMLEIAKPLGWKMTPEQTAKIQEVQREYPRLKDAIVKAEARPMKAAKAEQKGIASETLSGMKDYFNSLTIKAMNLADPKTSDSSRGRQEGLKKIRSDLQMLENHLEEQIGKGGAQEAKLQDLIAEVFQRNAKIDEDIAIWEEKTGVGPAPEGIQIAPLTPEEMDAKEAAIAANGPVGEPTQITPAAYLGEQNFGQQTKAQARNVPKESVDETAARLRAESDRTENVFGSKPGERSAEAAELPPAVEMMATAEDAAAGIVKTPEAGTVGLKPEHFRGEAQPASVEGTREDLESLERSLASLEARIDNGFGEIPDQATREALINESLQSIERLAAKSAELSDRIPAGQAKSLQDRIDLLRRNAGVESITVDIPRISSDEVVGPLPDANDVTQVTAGNERAPAAANSDEEPPTSPGTPSVKRKAA